jgi:hypothetical protein
MQMLRGGWWSSAMKTHPPQPAVTAVTAYDGVWIEWRGTMLQTGTSMSCACAGQTHGRVWGLRSVLQVYLGCSVPERGELSRVPLACLWCSTKDARWCVLATLVILLSLWSRWPPRPSSRTGLLVVGSAATSSVQASYPRELPWDGW